MSDLLERLAGVIESRRHGDAETSYVARLFAKGQDAVLKKIGEEWFVVDLQMRYVS